MKRKKEPSRNEALVVAIPGELMPPGGGRPEDNPVLQYLLELRTPASVRTMKNVLKHCAVIFDAMDREIPAEQSAVVDVLSYDWKAPGALTAKKMQTAITVIARRGRTMANLARAALRGVARHAYQLRQLELEERVRIDDVRAIKVHASDRGRRLTDTEIRRMFKVCAEDDTPKGRRDAALLALALGGGLRRFELAGLNLEDYTRPSRLGRDPVELRVKGKGDKPATVVAPPDVAEAVESWLETRGREPGPLFTSSAGRGRELELARRLSDSGVYDIMKRRGFEAEIAPEIAPHDLRRTAITVFLERTGDLALAKSFARHTSPSTTARYDKRGHEALRKALAGARTGFAAE